jgi:UDP-N-acetylmuramyl pentapeptide phosphotransferase/UDP-N-acetylglucosamine-1-phosphate transferase
VTLLLGALAGFLTGRLCWLLLRPTFDQPVFLRENFRGRVLPTSVGVVLPVTVLLVEAVRAVAGAAGVGDVGPMTQSRVLVLVVALGFGLLGLLDDLAGWGPEKGIRGHAVALVRGRLTTGGLKLVGGAAVALVACAPVAGDSVGRLLRDGALVALAANLGNLFDRRPGRALKASALAFVILAVLAGTRSPLVEVAVVIGAGLALLVDDLHEHCMLGDTGANVLGGALGMGVVVACSSSTRTIVLIVVAVLNVVSELVSFSRVIDAVPPLRVADRWGQRLGS